MKEREGNPSLSPFPDPFSLQVVAWRRWGREEKGKKKAAATEKTLPGAPFYSSPLPAPCLHLRACPAQPRTLSQRGDVEGPALLQGRYSLPPNSHLPAQSTNDTLEHNAL